VRSCVFPGRAGPSGAKLGVLSDGIFIVVSIACRDQSGTAAIKPRQQVERGTVAFNEVTSAHLKVYPFIPPLANAMVSMHHHRTGGGVEGPRRTI
jgi:hypothetical protein